MEINIKPGTKKILEKTVEQKDTAAAYGSGLIEVFASPAMIALMENTALEAVSPQLPEGYNTVGMHVDIKHLKPTPVGMKVKCEATLLEAENKKLKFQLEAWDEEGKIGTGTHKRFVIDQDSFMKQLSGDNK